MFAQGTRYHCYRNTLKHQIKRKTDKTPRKCECFTSIFVEMIAVVSFFTTQNSLLLLSEFSVDVRTRFFLLSLVTFFPFSSERKRERK